MTHPSEGFRIGPDVWGISLTGEPFAWQTTFANWAYWENFEFRQAYPGTYPGGDYPAYTGATERGSLGYIVQLDQGSEVDMDSVYHLSFVIPHSADSFVLNFSASGLQSLADESWGLDNIEVRVVRGQ
jgi:hypothetical protein